MGKMTWNSCILIFQQIYTKSGYNIDSEETSASSLNTSDSDGGTGGLGPGMGSGGLSLQ